MIDFTNKSHLKYLLFGGLYFTSGIQAALALVLIIIYFTDLDISIATATMIAGIGSLPFAFKFLFGPLTDYFIQIGRKPFIIIGGITAGICTIPLAFIDPTNALELFTILLIISMLGIILLDVATDAWAIQVTTIPERGKINASMFGGLFIGMATGNILLTSIADTMGYPMTFIITGSILLLALGLPLMFKEEIIVKKRPKILKLLLNEFKKKNTIIIALFSIFAALNFGMVLFILPEFMMNVLKLDIAQTGLITSLYPIGVAIGAITGGLFADKWGRKTTLFLFLFGAMIASSLLITVDSWMKLAILYPIIGFLQGGSSYSALMALFMDISNPKIGATQFSVLTSITNFGDYGIAIFSGALVIMLGYTRFFLYAAWVVGPALLILYFVKETIR
jgi:PAT family beta-lactamase induction signal transducer AmpG